MAQTSNVSRETDKNKVTATEPKDQDQEPTQDPTIVKEAEKTEEEKENIKVTKALEKQKAGFLAEKEKDAAKKLKKKKKPVLDPVEVEDEPIGSGDGLNHRTIQ